MASAKHFMIFRYRVEPNENQMKQKKQKLHSIIMQEEQKRNPTFRISAGKENRQKVW